MIVKEVILTVFNLRLVPLKFQDQLLFVSINTKIGGLVVANAHFILVHFGYIECLFGDKWLYYNIDLSQ